MTYTSVNGTFTYTITNNTSYVFDSTDYAIIQSAFDRWDNIMTLDSRVGAGYTITISYSVDVLEVGTLGGASIQTVGYIGSQTFGNTFPYEAEITLNAIYLTGMKNAVRNDGKTSYYYVLLHEIGHILGIGSFWNLPGTPKVSYLDNGVTKYYYTGANALREYKYYFADKGSSSFVGVPIEDNGGAGTANVHPEEGPEGGVSADNRYINGILHHGLDTELMTGWLDSAPVSTPLSRITLGFLADMGYTVNYNLADVYIMSWPATTDANNLDKAYVRGYLDVSGTTNLRQATTLGSTLVVTGATILGSTLAVTGATILGSTLAVTGETILGSTLDVNGITVGRGAGNIASNIAFGPRSLTANTTGANNNVFGADSLKNNTTGNNNNSHGLGSLLRNTTGTDNNALGSFSLFTNESGSNNNAFGTNSLYNTTGDNNTAIGYLSGRYNTTGSFNTFLGYQTDVSGTTATWSNSTALGAGAKITASNQIALGTAAETVYIAGTTALAGALNVNGLTIGRGGGNIDTNSAFGNNALNSNTTGNQNNAFGGSALIDNTAGSGNNAFGYEALWRNTTSANNSAFGHRALYLSTGASNSAFGREALRVNTTGSSNSGIGETVLYSNTTGNFNSAVGQSAGYSNTTGNSNTFLGAGTNISPTTATWSNSTAIGANAQITASNQIVLGTEAETVLVAGATTLAGALAVTGATTLVSTLAVAGATRLNGALAVTGATTLGSTLAVTGATTLGSTLAVTGATTLGTTLAVTGATTLGSTLAVTGATTLGSTLAVSGATILAGTLAVTGATTLGTLYAVYPSGSIPQSALMGGLGSNNFSSDLTMQSRAFISGDVSMNSKLFVGGATTLGSTLAVTGATTLVSTLAVNGATTLAGTLAVTGATTLGTLYASYPASSIPSSAIIGGVGSNNFTADVSMNAKLYVGGAATLASTLSVAGATTINNTLYQLNSQADFVNTNVNFTNGDVTFLNGNLITTGNVNLSKLNVTGATTLGTLYASYPASSIPSSAIIGGVGSNVFTADASMNAKLSVGGDVSMNSKLFVGGATTLGSRLAVTGAATLASTLDVTGATTLASTLNVTGITTLNNDVIAKTKITINQQEVITNGPVNGISNTLSNPISLSTAIGNQTFNESVVSNADGTVFAEIINSNQIRVTRRTGVTLTSSIITSSTFYTDDISNVTEWTDIFISHDGTKILVGATSATVSGGPSGVLVLFTYESSSWIYKLEKHFNDSNFGSIGMYGLSGDGNYLIYSRSSNNAYYVHTIVGSALTNEIITYGGGSFIGICAISNNGLFIAIRGINDVDVYKRATTWYNVVASDIGSYFPLKYMTIHTNDGQNLKLSTLEAIGAQMFTRLFNIYDNGVAPTVVPTQVFSRTTPYAGTIYKPRTNSNGKWLIAKESEITNVYYNSSTDPVNTTSWTTIATGDYYTISNDNAVILTPTSVVSPNVLSSQQIITYSGGLLNAGDISGNGTINIGGNATFNRKMRIEGDVSMNANVDISGQVTMKSGLTVVSPLVANGTTALASTLAVTGATTLVSTLAVTGATRLGSTLAVNGATTLAGTLAVTGATTLGTLYASYPASSIPSSAIIGGVGSNSFTADVSMNAKLSVGGDVSMNAKLQVSGATTLGNTLAVTGVTTLAGNLGVTGAATITGTLRTGATTITGTLHTGATTITGTLETGSITTTGTLTAGASTLSGETTLTGPLSVTGRTTLANTLAVTGAATIYGTVYATNWANNTIPSSAIIGGVGSNVFTDDASMNARLFVGGDVSMNSKLYVGGAATLGSTLNVNGIIVGRGGGNVDSNSAFGNSALNANTTGSTNSAFGRSALQSNTTGSTNSAFGTYSQWSNSVGNNNTSIGFASLYTNTASNNTALGLDAGRYNTTGANNTFLGYQTDVSGITATWSNSTAIGSRAKITASNQIALGTAAETVFVAGATTLASTLAVTGEAMFYNTIRQW